MIFVWTRSLCVGKIGMSDKGRRGLHEGGGTVWNTLKGGETEKRGGETKILKRSRKLGQGVGTLKREMGAWNPLMNYGYEVPINSCPQKTPFSDY